MPSHTESLHELGLADRVVGRTRFCIAPKPWVESVPTVGGTKDADLEKIMALRPDLVVMDKDENPLDLVNALQARDVPVLWSEIDTVEDAADFLRRLADHCGVPDAGQEQAVAIEEALAEVSGRRPVPVFCPIWYGPWMTFDATAYPHAMLAAVGFHNVFADHRGPKYFQVEEDDVAESEARLTLLPTEPFPFHRQLDRVDTHGLGAAGRSEAVHVIDGEALTWFGTRTAKGLRQLAEDRDRLA